MAVTPDELSDFQLFAEARLANGGAECMAELVAAWEAKRQFEQSIAALDDSDADAEAGRVLPAEEVFADARKNLGIPPE